MNKNVNLIRFEAETDGYNRKVKGAVGTLQQLGIAGKQCGLFIGQLDKLLGTSIGTLGKLSVGAGAVTGAVKVLNDAFIKCEANVDFYNSTMSQATSAYTTFCSALRSGDWGNFIEDMKTAASYASDLYTALDELSTFQVASSVDFARIDRDRAQNKLNLKRGDITKEQYNQIEASLANEENNLIAREKDLSTNSAMASLLSGAADQQISTDKLLEYFSGDINLKTVDDAKAELKKQRGELKQILKEESVWVYKEMRENHTSQRPVTTPYQDLIKEYEKDVKALEYLANPDNFAKATEAYKLQQQAYMRETQILRNQTKGYKDEGATGGNTNKAINVRSSSLGLASAKKSAPTPLGAEIVKLQDKVKGIKFEVPPAIQEYLHQLEIENILLREAADKTIEHQKAMESLKETANGISTAFSAAGDALREFGEGSQEAQIGAKILSIGASISALISQFAVLPKGNEIWSWIAGTAAGTAQLIATIASIKSAAEYHAEGGFVGQNNIKRGTDTVFAGLTPGELVLNRAQQSNLAGQLRSTGSNYNSGGNSYVSGEQLVTVINNYGRRSGRGEILR